MSEASILRHGTDLVQEGVCNGAEILRRRSEGEVVGAVGDELVAKGLQDGAVAEEEDAGHAFNVAGRSAEEVAAAPGGEYARDAFGIQILIPMGANETERLIEVAFGIGEAGEVFKM